MTEDIGNIIKLAVLALGLMVIAAAFFVRSALDKITAELKRMNDREDSREKSAG